MFTFFMTTGNIIIVPANSHFFGSTKNINGYQIVFSPYPSVPIAGDNSTLINLSLLDSENHNINNISASLVIKEKNTGIVVKVFPFKSYELSDITVPYTFQKMLFQLDRSLLHVVCTSNTFLFLWKEPL